MDIKALATVQKIKVTKMGRPLWWLTSFSAYWVGLGAWLLLLFYVTIVMMVMSLTAHQLLHKVSMIEVNGEPVSVARVKEFQKDLDQLEAWDKSVKVGFEDARKNWRRRMMKLNFYETKFKKLMKVINRVLRLHWSVKLNTVMRY